MKRDANNRVRQEHGWWLSAILSVAFLNLVAVLGLRRSAVADYIDKAMAAPPCVAKMFEACPNAAYVAEYNDFMKLAKKSPHSQSDIDIMGGQMMRLARMTPQGYGFDGKAMMFFRLPAADPLSPANCPLGTYSLSTSDECRKP